MILVQLFFLLFGLGAGAPVGAVMGDEVVAAAGASTASVYLVEAFESPQNYLLLCEDSDFEEEDNHHSRTTEAYAKKTSYHNRSACHASGRQSLFLVKPKKQSGSLLYLMHRRFRL